MPELATAPDSDAPAVHEGALDIVWTWLERRELAEECDEREYAAAQRLHDALLTGASLTRAQVSLFKRIGRDHIEGILSDIEDMVKG